MYTEEMLESIKKRRGIQNIQNRKRNYAVWMRMKNDNLLKEFHPDYKESGFGNLKDGPEQGREGTG